MQSRLPWQEMCLRSESASLHRAGRASEALQRVDLPPCLRSFVAALQRALFDAIHWSIESSSLLVIDRLRRMAV